MPYINTQSTVTLQKVVNDAMTFGDIEPVLNVAGAHTRAKTIATDVMNAILSEPFPYKFNEIEMPQFVTNSYQQDYAGIFPDGTSVTNLSWLERGIVVDINNTAQPKPYRMVEVGRQLPQATGTMFNSATSEPLYLVNWFPNNNLYYGTWGEGQTGNASLGNNPVAGSVYTNPYGPNLSQPANPIAQIKDANGNLLVLTTYGTEATNAPVAPANSAAGVTAVGVGPSFVFTGVTSVIAGVSGTYTGTITGGDNNALVGLSVTTLGFSNPANNGVFIVLFSTDTTLTLANTAAVVDLTAGTGTSLATTVWTVVDPYGMGFRILPVPTQTGCVWQFSLWGQALPIRFTSLQQTLFPLPDQYESNFRQLFVAQCYRYSTDKTIRAKFHDEWQLGLEALKNCRVKSDRELEENMFSPDRGIMGGQQGRNRWYGPQWPFAYPTAN